MDRLTPPMLRDLAHLWASWLRFAGPSTWADWLREEAARREAEAPDPRTVIRDDHIGVETGVRTATQVAREGPGSAAAPADPDGTYRRILDDFRKSGEPTEWDKANADALVHGTGVLRDGKHVPLDEWRAEDKPAPADDLHRAIDKLSDAVSRFTRSNTHQAQTDYKAQADALNARDEIKALFAAEKARADKLAAALKSIADNSCCTPCLEAGLVARQALTERGDRG